MRQYVIAPINNLELMNEGDDIFVLAHLWLKYPGYREFILEQKKVGKFITLDNSAAERALVTQDKLIEIVKELRPNEVIAPDVLFDKNSTIENLESFIAEMKKQKLIEGTKIFFCPQGRTKKEWLDCYLYGLNHEDVSVIGFSKIAVPRAWLSEEGADVGIMEGRHKAYNYLKRNNLLRKPIHCLGQGNPMEFTWYSHPMMRSSDSVWPVLAGDLDVDFNKDLGRVPTDHDYLEKGHLKESSIKLAKKNIAFVRAKMDEGDRIDGKLDCKSKFDIPSGNTTSRVVTKLG